MIPPAYHLLGYRAACPASDPNVKRSIRHGMKRCNLRKEEKADNPFHWRVEGKGKPEERTTSRSWGEAGVVDGTDGRTQSSRLTLPAGSRCNKDS
ncbi:hypothetical protein AVEN_184884-1 [Araneus ventricosus]|uniref:Uncharacterized protein n=1 Tax=Araneus ventricosus TaxID=182803 RepID=A0A4Y2GD86_ARAVE|nr:hypothetical protein AVEN_184884-1 [Araneus ventricosus]